MDPIPSMQASASAAEGEVGEHAHLVPQDGCSAAKRPRGRPRTKPMKAACSTSRRGRGRGRAPAARSTAVPTAQPVGRKRKWMSWAERVAATKVSRPCRECFREFSCGKALFGHMRWHSVPWWQGVRKPTEQKQAPSALAVTPPDGTPPVAEGASQGGQAEMADACPLHMKGKAVRKPKTSKQKEDQGSQGVVKPVSAAVSAAGPSSATGVRGCGIDLNLPPPEEAEERADPPSSSAIQKDFRKLPAFHGFV